MAFTWSELLSQDESQQLDTVFAFCDDCLFDQRMDTLDIFLASVPVSACSWTLLIGILTATLPARNLLSTRKEFLVAVWAELARSGLTTDQIIPKINGLE